MQEMVAVDIGNSSMKVAANDRKNLFRINSDLDSKQRSEQLAAATRDLNQPNLWLVCSVDSRQSEWLQDWVASNRPEDKFHLIHANDVPLTSHVENRDALGRDRLLGAWYAAVRTADGNTAIIVDAGTAVTIDVAVPDKGHVGGLIFPGVGTCLSTVSAQTDALPDLSNATPPELSTDVQLGMATEPAILLGVHQLQLFGIVAMVRSIEHQYADASVWCCGGALEHVSHLLPGSWNYDRDFLIDAIFHLQRSLS